METGRRKLFSKSKKPQKLPLIQITPVTYTLEALDLHSPIPYNTNNADFLSNRSKSEQRRRGSLCTENELNLISNENYKSRSDTFLNEDGNANKSRAQNPNWTKTFASIDNKCDRAHVATKQEGVKKKLNLIQRKISVELMVDHLEKSLQQSEKKSTNNDRQNTFSSPATLEKRITELKGELKSIDTNLKAVDEQQEDAIKGIYANKSKEYDVMRLLEETTGNAHSKSIAKKSICNDNQLISPIINPQNEDKLGKIKRRKTVSPFWPLSNAGHIRRNFRSIRRITKKKPDNDENLSESHANSNKTPPNQREVSESGITSAVQTEKNCPGNASETSSSEEDEEIQTEISQKTWQEIAAFELLIAEHMTRRREYDFPYIDQD